MPNTKAKIKSQNSKKHPNNLLKPLQWKLASDISDKSKEALLVLDLQGMEKSNANKPRDPLAT